MSKQGSRTFTANHSACFGIRQCVPVSQAGATASNAVTLNINELNYSSGNFQEELLNSSSHNKAALQAVGESVE